jgi:hypothetical protein
VCVVRRDIRTGMNEKGLEKDLKYRNMDVRTGKHEKETTQKTQPKEGDSTDRIYT